MSIAKIEFFKVKASRTVRGAYRNLKKKASKGHTNAVDDLFGGEDVEMVRETNREKKFKSTAIVFAAGTAMGISHVAAISSKYDIKVSPKGTMLTGLSIGLSTAGIWYNYIDAAEHDVNEEDIEMMFEMMSSTGFGDLDKDEFKKEHGKALDILHVMVTGKEEVEDDKVVFEYEDDDEDDDGISSDNAFATKPKITDNSSSSSGLRERSIGISKPLRMSGRKSFLPDLDREEAEEKAQPREGWLDLG